LYDFFLEASNLKDMKEKHQQTLSMIEKAKADVEAAEAKLPTYEEAAAKAKAEYDGAVALKRMDAQLEELNKVAMWACIAEREKRLEAQSAAEAAAEADLRKNTQEHSAARDEFKAQEKALQEAQAEADDLMKQAQDASSSGKALLEAQNKRKKSIKLAQRAATTARDEGQTLEEQITQARAAHARRRRLVDTPPARLPRARVRRSCGSTATSRTSRRTSRRSARRSSGTGSRRRRRWPRCSGRSARSSRRCRRASGSTTPRWRGSRQAARR